MIKQLMIATILFGANQALAGGPPESMRPWPKLHEVILRAIVTVEEELYRYGYTLQNSIKNSAEYPLYFLDIDLRLKPEEHPLSTADLSRSHTFGEHTKILNQSQRIQLIKQISPSELPWTPGFAGVWSVDDFKHEHMLKPGGTLAGFFLLANEPPGIREFTADAYDEDFTNYPEWYEFPGRPDLKGREMEAEVNKGIQWLGKTIAPVTPPKPFNASTWTDKMLSDAQEARKQGWIKTDKNLEQIKKLLADLNTEDKKKLQKAVKAIEKYVQKERKAGNLTDEADALGRLNAQYLWDRLYGAKKSEGKESKK